jgi:hypothetical protein
VVKAMLHKGPLMKLAQRGNRFGARHELGTVVAKIVDRGGSGTPLHVDVEMAILIW